MPEISTFINLEQRKVEATIFEGADQAIMIMCHPHSLMGGTMNNKIVTTIVRAFQQKGCTTIRFNFRGVALSDGTFDNGVGEAEDVRAIMEWARIQWPGRAIILGGFSFGAYVALRAAQHEVLQNLLLIAPAVDRMDFNSLNLPDCPCYLVVAGEDEVTSTPAILTWAEHHPFRKIVNLEGASHFFHGRLIELRDTIMQELFQ